MEKIELRVELRSGVRLEKPWAAIFGLAGGTIGRGGQNKLILPDVDSTIARVHAMVRLGANDVYIANLCERRLIDVDGQEVRPGQEVPLPLGASICLGPYMIGVYSLDADQASTPAHLSADATPLLAAPAHAEPQKSNANSLRSVVQEIAPTQPARSLVIPDDFNPFEVISRPVPKDEWGGLQAQSLTELAQQSHDGLIRTLPLSGTMNDDLDNPAHSGLPRQLDPTPQLDPLELFSQSSILASPELAEVPVVRSSELSHVFHLPTARRDKAAEPTHVLGPTPAAAPTPHASEESLQAVQSAGLQTVQGLDLSLFGQEHSSVSSPSPVIEHASSPKSSEALDRHPSVPAPEPELLTQPSLLPDAVVDTNAALEAFGLRLSGSAPAALRKMPAPASTPAADVYSATTTQENTLVPSGSLEALEAAFLVGAGLTADRAKLNLTPEFMRAFGEAFRVAIEGSIDLLAARSEIKQEFRAGVTIIGSSANNPLKFLPNADGVIMQLIGQQFPGFMRPVPAIKEAYDDLRVHQLALMAGIRAAYSEALMCFDPVRMERETPKTGILGNLYEGKRKAALWDEYKKNFSRLKNTAEDDLTAFSGQTFVQAYEAAANAAKRQS